jgi:flagellar assembly protein FliH
MEYCEADGSFEAGQPFNVDVEHPRTAIDAEPPPDSSAAFAARLEEETRAIAAQMRGEAEREVQRARAAISHAIDAFALQRDAYYQQAEREVVDLALAIARRIIHRETQIDPRLLEALVHHEIEQLDAATSVRLVVSPDALASWNEAASAMPRTVEVHSDRALSSGDIRIETALGVTSINFERELKEIERGFFDLLSHRPAPAESRAVRVQ